MSAPMAMHHTVAAVEAGRGAADAGVRDRFALSAATDAASVALLAPRRDGCRHRRPGPVIIEVANTIIGFVVGYLKRAAVDAAQGRRFAKWQDRSGGTHEPSDVRRLRPPRARRPGLVRGHRDEKQ